jgi:tRNA A37 threonylcarbamoyltransferase TsaD
MPGSGQILAIESSCDETAAAIVQRGAHTLSSVVASQIATHARYGGVVPELASREHLRAIVPVVRAALAQANTTLADLDAIAVTSGPGLAGALLVGITYAKALAFANNLPLIAVNHLEGHIHAVLLNERESQTTRHPQQNEVASKDPPLLEQTSGAPCLDSETWDRRRFESPETPFTLGNTPGAPCLASETWDRSRFESPETPFTLGNTPGAPGLASETWDRSRFESPETPFTLGNTPGAPCLASETWESQTSDDPALALVVSGGHTHLYLATPTANTWRYTLIGRTLDDAAGEAYDKVAKLLGLGYPGGPWIDALALHGNPRAVPFSFAQFKPKLRLSGELPRTKAAKTAPIANLDPHFLFSFSGIKTAVLRYVELHNLRPEAESRRETLFTGPDAPGNPKRPGALGPAFGTWETTKPTSSKTGPTIDDALANCDPQTLDLIASFQHAVVGDLLKKTFAAAESLGVRRILVTGGVAANRELRQRFTAEAARRNSSHPERLRKPVILSDLEGRVESCHPERPKEAEGPAVAFRAAEGNHPYVVSFPTLALSTDNAAMIAAAAWPRFLSGDFAPPTLSADPSLALGR